MRPLIIVAGGLALAMAVVWWPSSGVERAPFEARPAEPARSVRGSSDAVTSSAVTPVSSAARRAVTREALPSRAERRLTAAAARRPDVIAAPSVARTALPVVPSVARVELPRSDRDATAQRARRAGEPASPPPAPSQVLARDAVALGEMADMFAGDALRDAVTLVGRSAERSPPPRP